MAVSSISPTELLKTATSATGRAKVSQDDFLKLLIVELQSQDPFEPMKNQEFLNQIVSLNQLESNASLTDGIRSLKLGTDLANASALLGKAVIGTTDAGVQGGGVVSRVLVQDGEVRLVIGDQTMSLTGVSQVFVPAATPVPEES